MTTRSRQSKADEHQTVRAVLLAAVEFVRRAVYFEYICLTANDTERGRPPVSRTLYADWDEEHAPRFKADRARLEEPIQSALAARRTSVLPSEIADAIRARPDAADFKSFLDGHGLPLPLAVPIFHLQRMYGTVAFFRHKPYHPDEVHYLGLVAPALHRDFARDQRATLDGNTHLTAREIECLRHASAGMTSEEIAGVMPLAAATVTAQLRSAAAKLGAANRVSAIAEAIRRGIID